MMVMLYCRQGALLISELLELLPLNVGIALHFFNSFLVAISFK